MKMTCCIMPRTQLEQIPGLKIIGKAKEKISLVSFIIDKIHPQDIGILLDNRGIAVRTGHHCAQPLMDRFGIPGTSGLPLPCTIPRKRSMNW